MEIIFLFAPVSDVVLEGSGAAPDRREEFLGIYAHSGCLLLLLLLLTPSPFAPPLDWVAGPGPWPGQAGRVPAGLFWGLVSLLKLGQRFLRSGASAFQLGLTPSCFAC